MLTVTSKKLQSMTQGRKYRGAPQRSVADRKKTSACAACGQVGHWAGNPECPASAKGKGKGKADDGKNAKGPPNASPADRKNSSGVHKVFSVRHATGAEILYSFDAMPNNDLTGQDPPSSRVHRTFEKLSSLAWPTSQSCRGIAWLTPRVKDHVAADSGARARESCWRASVWPCCSRTDARPSSSVPASRRGLGFVLIFPLPLTPATP